MTRGQRLRRSREQRLVEPIRGPMMRVGPLLQLIERGALAATGRLHDFEQFTRLVAEQLRPARDARWHRWPFPHQPPRRLRVGSRPELQSPAVGAVLATCSSHPNSVEAGAQHEVRGQRAAPRYVGQPHPVGNCAVRGFHHVVPTCRIGERCAVMVFQPHCVIAIAGRGFQPPVAGPCDRPTRLGIGCVLSQRTDIFPLDPRTVPRNIAHHKRSELGRVVIAIDHP